VADGEDATEEDGLEEVCIIVGESWQTVCLWISDEAAAEHGLVSELEQLTGDDETHLPAGSIPSYKSALQLVERPWSSPEIQLILCKFTCNPPLVVMNGSTLTGCL